MNNDGYGTKQLIVFIFTDILVKCYYSWEQLTDSENVCHKWDGAGSDTAKLVNFKTCILWYLRLRQEFTSVCIDAKVLISESYNVQNLVNILQSLHDTIFLFYQALKSWETFY